MSKSGFSHEEFDAFIGVLKLRVDFVPLEKFLDKLGQAKEISPHAKDIEYFAVALKFESDCVWSEEKLLKEQAKVKVLNTDELWEFLNSESEDK